MRSETIEPKTRTLRFEQTVLICARCECEYKRVYLYKGSWFCLLCLKDVVRDAGAGSAEIYGSSWRAEAVRNASAMKCIDVRVRDRKSSLARKGLLVPRKR
jgi:hypothetical protein